ncbi:uncharacterized protein LOC108000196 isoform X2 [Apis cerana]|uniref:uncharacterized protein LOC108000196 isoform X2 n=1 Tax=Apis cerana TaxID=7461 RepID=UPI002B2296DE|nr:uncharacterized protein LOC108000196 isoform X2 [Apis cerana]
MRAPLMPSLFPRNDKSERKVGRKSFPRPILRRFCARMQRKSIMLQCRKANLLETRGKKGRRGRVSTVSWIKRKNVQELLTVGLTTYANDERFQAIHFHHSEDWTLQIKYVQPRDAGLYQCQVSTHPPTSIFLFLEVVEARAEIAGPSEKFVRPGSTLQLHCLVKKSTETPSYLFWYHNFRMINYDVDQGVNVSTDLVGRESWLEVPRASDRHSGNYTCEASNAQPARVLVHVFKGDNPAAMQHSIASSPSVMACSALLMMFTTLKLVFHSTTTN